MQDPSLAPVLFLWPYVFLFYWFKTFHDLSHPGKFHLTARRTKNILFLQWPKVAKGPVLQGSKGSVGPSCQMVPHAHPGMPTCSDCPPKIEREKRRERETKYTFYSSWNLRPVAKGGPGTIKKEKGIDTKLAVSLWCFISTPLRTSRCCSGHYPALPPQEQSKFFFLYVSWWSCPRGVLRGCVPFNSHYSGGIQGVCQSPTAIYLFSSLTSLGNMFICHDNIFVCIDPEIVIKT